MFFVILVVPLLILAPRSTPDFVFAQIMNEGGWESNGISWCLGLLTVTYCFLGRLKTVGSMTDESANI